MAGAGSVAFGGTTLYVGAVEVGSSGLPSGSTIMVLRASSGALAWRCSQTSGVQVPFAASGDAVFANAVTFSTTGAPSSSTIEALRANNGTPLWSAALNGVLGSPATVGNGALYLVTFSVPAATSKTPPAYTLLALDTGTGKPLWHLALQGSLSGYAPVLSNGVLYLSEQNLTNSSQTTISPASLILVVRAGDGTVLWHAMPPVGGAPGSLVGSGGAVCYSYGLVNGPGGGIVALHAADGGLAWQAPTQSAGPVALAADNRAIYALESVTTKSQSAASIQTTLLVFNASSGKSLLTRPFPSLLVQAEFGIGPQPQVAGGVLYVAAGSAQTSPGPPTPSSTQVSIVLALSTRDGSLQWQHEINGSVMPMLFIAP